MTLDEAQEAFRAALSRRKPGKPTKAANKAAGAYMAALMEYEADDMIGDDTWLNGLAEINAYLSE